MRNQTSAVFLWLLLWTTASVSAIWADEFHSGTGTRLTPSEEREVKNSRTPCQRRRELYEKWSGLKTVDLTIPQYKASHAYPGIWASCKQSCQPNHVTCAIAPGKEQAVAQVLKGKTHQDSNDSRQRPGCDAVSVSPAPPPRSRLSYAPVELFPDADRQRGFRRIGWTSVATPSSWDAWMNNDDTFGVPGLRWSIWKAQNTELQKSVYASPNRFVTPGPNLSPKMKWKDWWAESNVCVTVTLEFYAKPHDPLNTTFIVLKAPTLTDPNDPNRSYLLFLQTKILPPFAKQDGLVPPWPMTIGGQPMPHETKEEGPHYDVSQNLYRFELPYKFTLTKPPKSSAGKRTG